MNSIILILPILVALFFSLRLLINPSYRIMSSKVLAFYLSLYTIILTAIFSVFLFPEEGILAPLVNMLSLLFFVALLAVPSTLYFYVITLTQKYEKFNKIEKILPHYYPALALLIINFFAYGYLYTSSENHLNYPGIQTVMEYANLIALLFAFPLLSIYYIYKSMLSLKNHDVKIKEVYAFNQGIDLKWVRTFILGYIIFITGMYLIQLSPSETLSVSFGVFLSLYLGFIGIKGLQQNFIRLDSPRPFAPQIQETAPIAEEQLPPKKQGTEAQEDIADTLQEEKRTALKEKLLFILEEEEIFLEKKLSIHQLAQKLNSNNKYLSQLLNSDFNQNFASFINTYRIRKAKEILAQQSAQALTIESIAQASGFNSKSAFNIAFKNIVGETPSAYRKKMQDNALDK